MEGDFYLPRFSYALALLFVVFGSSASAQQPTIPRPDGATLTPAQIDSTVTHLIQAAHVTGIGLALFHHGKVVYLKGYGLRDVEKNLPLTPDSVVSMEPAALGLVHRSGPSERPYSSYPLAKSLSKPGSHTILERVILSGQ